jgi:hypothetical protein
VFISCGFRAHEKGIAAMNEIGRQVFRSGAYALLAAAFVLACSLLLPAEEGRTQLASRSDSTELTAYSGSTQFTVPEPGAGR